MHYKLSIIIPVLNEAKHIGDLLDYLTADASEYIEEIIVVDGGSTDNSKSIISKFTSVVLLNSVKGRAKQLNFGAKRAKANVLYFLHADSVPPKNFAKQIILALNNNYQIGSFRLKFDIPSHFLLKISQWSTRLNFSLFRGGDQSLFIPKHVFNELNGFDERYIIYEDIEFIKRIYKHYKFKVLPDYVVTSARRFHNNGIWKLHFNFFVIHVKSFFAASPEHLYKYYMRHIKN